MRTRDEFLANETRSYRYIACHDYRSEQGTYAEATIIQSDNEFMVWSHQPHFNHDDEYGTYDNVLDAINALEEAVGDLIQHYTELGDSNDEDYSRDFRPWENEDSERIYKHFTCVLID